MLGVVQPLLGSFFLPLSRRAPTIEGCPRSLPYSPFSIPTLCLLLELPGVWTNKHQSVPLCEPRIHPGAVLVLLKAGGEEAEPP